MGRGRYIRRAVATLAILTGCGGNYRGQNFGRGSYGGSYGGERAMSQARSAGSDWEAEVTYEPPSPLSRWGFRVLVLPFESEGATGITQRLAAVVDRTRTFDVVTGGAVHMAISGAVTESRIGQEAVDEESARCVRTVQETRTRRVPYEVEDPAPPPGPAAQQQQNYQQLGEAIGNIIVAASGGTPQPMSRRTHTEYRDEEYQEPVEQPYRCVTLTRHVAASFRLHVQVMARTRPVRVVYERDFSERDEARSTGRRGSDDADHEPDPVDGEALLRSLQERALEAFARENLPHSATETIRFEECGDERCVGALRLVRQGNFEEAERTLAELVQSDASPRARRAVAYTAAALYDRGIVRAYAGQFVSGMDDITRAISLSPGHPEWEARLARIREMQRAVGIEPPPPAPVRRPARPPVPPRRSPR